MSTESYTSQMLMIEAYRESTHRRIDLAIEQLDVAIELFLSKQSFVSALTLAGAAEEILGKCLERKGKNPWLNWEYTLLKDTKSLFRKNPYEKRDFIGERNRVRNAVKHMDEKDSDSVDANLEDEALDMIVRAGENYRMLDLTPTKNMGEFSDWFYKYVVGSESDY